MRASWPYAAVLLLWAASTPGATSGLHPGPGAKLRNIESAPAWMRRPSEANLPEIGTRRARLVIEYCGQCHSSPPPGIHDGDEWRWMIVQMDMRAMTAERQGLRSAGNDELMEISRYYEKHGSR